MAREVVVRCERHRDKEAEEVVIKVDGRSVTVDLCVDCRQPLIELMELGKPAPVTLPRQRGGPGRPLASRIRGLPPVDGMDGHR